MFQSAMNGTITNPISTGMKTKYGPSSNVHGSAAFGRRSSLPTSFTASATACSSPKGPVFCGPMRWLNRATIFRSRYV